MSDDKVSTETCDAITTGLGRELGDVKKRVDTLDARLWWILGVGFLSFIMATVTVVLQLNGA